MSNNSCYNKLKVWLVNAIAMQSPNNMAHRTCHDVLFPERKIVCLCVCVSLEGRNREQIKVMAREREKKKMPHEQSFHSQKSHWYFHSDIVIHWADLGTVLWVMQWLMQQSNSTFTIANVLIRVPADDRICCVVVHNNIRPILPPVRTWIKTWHCCRYCI